MIIVGTGRILNSADTSVEFDEVQSVYGLRDRLNGVRPALNKLVVQSLTGQEYLGEEVVRTSSAEPVPRTADGWLVDLRAGERVVTDLRLRSGRVIFTSTNPTIDGGDVWANEISYLTGGAPNTIVYDINGDGDLDPDDNVDGNDDGDVLDVEDRVTGIYQGGGIVVSSATLATVRATAGIYYINRIQHSQEERPGLNLDDLGPGIAGGHFDVDTSRGEDADNGKTASHTHEYDDKYDVMGVEFFAFLDSALNIQDVVNDGQRFKLLIVNAEKSPGGRLIINDTYDEANPKFVPVQDWAAIPIESLPVWTLDGIAGTQHLTQAGMYFDQGAILAGHLWPTQTGCVKSNRPCLRRQLAQRCADHLGGLGGRRR